MAVIKNKPGKPTTAPTLGTQAEYSEVNQGASSPTISWFEEHQKLIIGAVAAALGIAVLIYLYQKFVREPAQANAAAQMWEAQQLFEQDSFQLALTGRPGSGDGFLAIVEDYGSTASGNLANYYAGISYLHLGQYDAAISFLEDFDADGELLPVTKAGALGDAFAQKGDLDKAESFYKEALDEADENVMLAPYYLKKLGMYYEHKGDKAAANALYMRIQQEFPDSEEAGDIEKYIQRSTAQ